MKIKLLVFISLLGLSVASCRKQGGLGGHIPPPGSGGPLKMAIVTIRNCCNTAQISEVGEKERSRFFHALREKIEDSKKRK